MKRKSDPKIGFISLTDTPRALDMAKEREVSINKKHDEFKDYLLKHDIDVIDAKDCVKSESNMAGFYSSEKILEAVDVFISNHVEAVVIGCWHWSEPMFVVEIARAINKPILLYSDDDPAWAATCLLSAAGASLWETSPNRYAQVHERVYGDQEAVIKWIKGVCSLEKLKRENIILWGGSYALRMEYLQDDFPKLKSFLIGDILVEDQYVLIKYAEKIKSERIEKFIDWLTTNKTVLKYDNKTFTPEVLKKQVSLYLAAKDRIADLGKSITGASVKCFDELSDIYGVDPCFIPAFLPYHEDSEGKKEVISTVCEGDIKGLLTSMIFKNITGGEPALFGDVTYIGKKYFIISNCGASSVHYACSSCSSCDMLKNIQIEANCEGLTGGAVGYKCPPGKMTIARLVRSKGKYFMHLGRAEAVVIDDAIESKFYYGNTWPHTAIKMEVDQQLLVKALGANHLIAVFGDYIQEIRHACRQADIEVFRIDTEDGINKWIEKIAHL